MRRHVTPHCPLPPMFFRRRYPPFHLLRAAAFSFIFAWLRFSFRRGFRSSYATAFIDAFRLMMLECQECTPSLIQITLMLSIADLPAAFRFSFFQLTIAFSLIISLSAADCFAIELFHFRHFAIFRCHFH
jgi:hypothetical protein